MLTPKSTSIAFLWHCVALSEQKQRVMVMSSATLSKRLETLEEIERVRELQRKQLMLEQRQETETVLAQPHRRGDDGDMVDPLGVFVRAYKCGRECYEAGWDYFRLVYRWRVATGIPVPLRLSEGVNSAGGEMDSQLARQWLADIKRCENSMKCSGLPGFEAAQRLLLEAGFPEEKHVQPVKRALHSLAMELGKFPF